MSTALPINVFSWQDERDDSENTCPQVACAVVVAKQSSWSDSHRCSVAIGTGAVELGRSGAKRRAERVVSQLAEDVADVSSVTAGWARLKLRHKPVTRAQGGMEGWRE